MLGAIVDGVLVLILSVYLAASGPRLVRWAREQAPSGQRRRATEVIGIVSQVVGGYIRGTLILATLVGVLVGVGMALLHVRYALLLGILAFFMEFVPVLGVLVSGAVCVVEASRVEGRAAGRAGVLVAKVARARRRLRPTARE